MSKNNHSSTNFCANSSGFLFSWHLHGRDPMNAQVHTFLVSTIKACVALVVFEACVPREVIVGIARNGATMLQG